jgi:hypothetical protein
MTVHPTKRLTLRRLILAGSGAPEGIKHLMLGFVEGRDESSH